MTERMPSIQRSFWLHRADPGRSCCAALTLADRSTDLRALMTALLPLHSGNEPVATGFKSVNRSAESIAASTASTKSP